jgi:hypothetical protein
MAGRRRGERGAEEGVGDAAVNVVASETPAQSGVTAIKARIAELHARDAEALEQIERGEEQIQREQRVSEGRGGG